MLWSESRKSERRWMVWERVRRSDRLFPSFADTPSNDEKQKRKSVVWFSPTPYSEPRDADATGNPSRFLDRSSCHSQPAGRSGLVLTVNLPILGEHTDPVQTVHDMREKTAGRGGEREKVKAKERGTKEKGGGKGKKKFKASSSRSPSPRPLPLPPSPSHALV